MFQLFRENRFIVFSDFHGINSLTMVDFKLPILNWLTKFLKI